MAKLILVLDTNVVVDFLNEREPHYESARKLMICGRAGAFSSIMSSSQVTDLVYILTEGGKKSLLENALQSLRGLRSFIEVVPVGSEEIDVMLSSSWKDPEDFLLHEVALRQKADAIISRDKDGFESEMMPVFDCNALFTWLSEEFGLSFEELDIA